MLVTKNIILALNLKGVHAGQPTVFFQEQLSKLKIHAAAPARQLKTTKVPRIHAEYQSSHPRALEMKSFAFS